MSRAHTLLEKSSLNNSYPAETIPAIAPQMTSPPEYDLHNVQGYVNPTGKKHMEDDGWVEQDEPSTNEERLPVNRAQHILELMGTGQQLPYSTPGFHLHNPQKKSLGQSAATTYANKLRRARRDRQFSKAISATWKQTKVPPAMQKFM